MHITTLATALACLLTAACASTEPTEAAGWRQLELRDYRGALGSFEQALETSQDAALHAGRARALFLLGKYEQAGDGYRRAIAREARNPQWRLGLGLVELARGDPTAAIAACDAALDIDPRLARAYHNRGCALLQAQDPGGAEDDFTRAIRLEPGRAEAYNSRGVALARSARFEAALADFERAAELAPLGSAHGNRAAALHALGRTQQALTALNAAIRLERGSAVHYANRGRIYMDLRRADLAVPDFERALALAPGARGLSRLLADARERAVPRIQASEATPARTAHPAAFAD